MIRHVRGNVVGATDTSVVIEVAGFGIEVYTANPSAFKGAASLFTHLAVKQDGMDLYGFADVEDRDFFELTLSVPGIGPKTALALLKRSSREGLEGAVARRDLTYLTRVAGLSKKSAEKLVVELSERLTSKKGNGSGADAEVFDTLVALGYTEREARKAVASVGEDISGKEARLKAALSAGR